MTDEFIELKEKLVAIRKEIADLIKKIDKEAKGERFSLRIFLENSENGQERKIIGFVENLRVNGYILMFDLIEQYPSRNRKKVLEKVVKKEVPLDIIEGIETFKTESGRPVIVR